MLIAKGKLRADINGDLTIEEQITQANKDAFLGSRATKRQFENAIRYEITRTVCNILSNATIKYNGQSNSFCLSLQENIIDIYFTMSKFGYCYLRVDSKGIQNVSENKGNVVIYDKAYKQTRITQDMASKKQLEMYGIITDVKYSVLDERGVMGIFSPKNAVTLTQREKETLYSKFKAFFGAKKGQNKFGFMEVGMDYQGVSLPVAELNLLENEKMALGNVARIYQIQEDMLLRGGTYDNKDNAIVQTYTDYKGWIYGVINEIEKQIIRPVFDYFNTELYEVTFTGVPQLNEKQT